MTSRSPVRSSRFDDLLKILADRHCRTVLAYLRAAANGIATVDELAAELGDSGESRADRVVSRLHHSVLPRLEAAALVDYDARSETVRYRDHVVLDSLLESLEEHSPISERRT